MSKITKKDLIAEIMANAEEGQYTKTGLTKMLLTDLEQIRQQQLQSNVKQQKVVAVSGVAICDDGTSINFSGYDPQGLIVNVVRVSDLQSPTQPQN